MVASVQGKCADKTLVLDANITVDRLITSGELDIITYTLEFSGCESNGLLEVVINDDITVDLASNTNTGYTHNTGVIIDNILPVVTINAPTISVTANSAVHYNNDYANKDRTITYVIEANDTNLLSAVVNDISSNIALLRGTEVTMNNVDLCTWTLGDKVDDGLTRFTQTLTIPNCEALNSVISANVLVNATTDLAGNNSLAADTLDGDEVIIDNVLPTAVIVLNETTNPLNNTHINSSHQTTFTVILEDETKLTEVGLTANEVTIVGACSVAGTKNVSFVNNGGVDRLKIIQNVHYYSNQNLCHFYLAEQFLFGLQKLLF